MTCAEFKAQVHDYAIGALGPDEVERLEDHLAQSGPHDGCSAAWSEAEASAHLLALELPPQRPSAAVWDRIEERVAAEARYGDLRAPSRWRTFTGGLALAASVAAVALLIGRQVQRTQDLAERHDAEVQKETLTRAAQDQLGSKMERCRLDLQTAEAQLEAQEKGMRLLGRASTELVALAPTKKGSSAAGTVVFDRQAHEAVVVASSLVAQSGHDYELWIIRGKDKLPAGLLKVAFKGPTLATVDEKLLTGGVNMFAITLEPEGGSVQPRGELVLAGAVHQKG